MTLLAWSHILTLHLKGLRLWRVLEVLRGRGLCSRILFKQDLPVVEHGTLRSIYASVSIFQTCLSDPWLDTSPSVIADIKGFCKMLNYVRADIIFIVVVLLVFVIKVVVLSHVMPII